MRKRRDKVAKKAWKSGYEAKFEQMVGEYHSAKETLETMTAGSDEFKAQEKLCESLFSSAERFFKQHQ
ncbi:MULTISPECIES: hypothetical protein [Vibrio]|jgi:hypothetical protein|uniref:Uncharacterized protein n=1 Tax=Vibrio diazotrophicus TaxID=685 RepID=A0A2J8FY22_VIBDI|nr:MULTISPECIES: hypothetical protein [Vibrio]MCF7362012.1 hypothetical protein [Vibrio sp. A1-b2]MCZ4370239.1 hypothetical protein [Vibrio diazotrophicus]PNH78665.1 hypothetical protein C1N27_16390 [Vibrio diazotrophicus]PNH91276.1 hypothetical protein C1M59_15415 [Vibrio diazotrophicus]PNH99019.1 hypothetical protein C1O24_03025 [Vibrio diazotrophicus]